MNIIKALQNNILPFCKMDDRMRITAGQIGTDEFEGLNEFGEWVHVRYGKDGDFKLNLTYRLRADYKCGLIDIESAIEKK